MFIKEKVHDESFRSLVLIVHSCLVSPSVLVGPIYFKGIILLYNKNLHGYKLIRYCSSPVSSAKMGDGCRCELNDPSKV